MKLQIKRKKRVLKNLILLKNFKILIKFLFNKFSIIKIKIKMNKIIILFLILNLLKQVFYLVNPEILLIIKLLEKLKIIILIQTTTIIIIILNLTFLLLKKKAQKN
jgi:hypothetical protein